MVCCMLICMSNIQFRAVRLLENSQGSVNVKTIMLSSVSASIELITFNLFLETTFGVGLAQDSDSN